jgi:integrase
VLVLSDFVDREYRAWAEANLKTWQATLARLRVQFSDLLNRPMDQITPFAIEKWRNARIKAGIARATVNRDLVVLKAVLSKAVEWDVLDKHPLAKARLLKVDRLPLVRYLTPDEETRLRRALVDRETRIRTARVSANEWRRERNYPELPDLSDAGFADYLRPLVLLAMHTGLRRGELFNLRWSGVNFAAATITVDGGKAKSGHTRHVPLNKEALQVLRDWKGEGEREGLVFAGAGGKRLGHTRRSWAGVMKAVGISGFRFHDLRHHFASRLVMEGTDLNTVRELLGHADIQMVLRYAHLAPGHKAKAVSRLEAR